jgi:molecular chaperone GrpE
VVAGLQNQIDELTGTLRAAQAAASEWQTQAEAAQREVVAWQKQYQAAQREAAAWQAHAAGVQDEADRWQGQLTTAQQELQSAQNALAAVQAESVELRTRWQKRFADEAAQEKQRFVGALLPFIDHLELAIEHDRGDATGLRVGVETTLRGVLHTLAQLGITPLHALNQPFDPTVHEAVAVVPAADVASGTVVQVVQKGYLANEQLLRPARVVVSQ